MATTERFNNQWIRDLADTPGPCITIALAGDDAARTAIEMKEAVNGIRKDLQDRGVNAEQLLEPIAAAADGGAPKKRGGIVILRSPSILEVHRVPNVTPVAKVADHFDLRALLAIEASRAQFYILALSQNRTRILKCTRDSSEELPFPEGYANNLADAMQTPKPDHNLKNMASGGASMGGGAVKFGTSSDADDKDEYMLHFFMGLDKAVNAALGQSSHPLIVVGVEHEIALYRRVNTYPNLIEPGVHGAPDGLEGGEMHRRALDLMQQREEEPGHEVPQDFDKKVGTGHASIHLAEIVAAAYEGRVSQLFFQASARYLGTYDAVRQRVKRTEDPLDSPVDLIEAAGYETLRQNGEVKMLPASAMPNGVPVCALFRYPAPQSAGTPEFAATENERV